MKNDLVLVTVPFTETEIPLYAIAQLKTIALDAGWSCATIDLNNNYLSKIEDHFHSSRLVDWFYNETYYQGIEEFVLEMIDDMSNKILAHSPRVVGISLFTYGCQVATKYLCISLKQKNPNIEIILGGSGLFENVGGESKYLDSLLDMKLVDHYFVGDAELAFRDWLNGKSEVSGVNNTNWKELTNTDLNNIPYANFDDYDWSMYKTPVIPMTASRGCVRRCKFCNDIVHWKLFSFRTGQNIFDEMIHQKNKYNISHFSFTDALINGNVKEFRALCQLLADYNSENPEDKISWESQFIFRPRKQFTESDWDLLAMSNPTELSVGIESLDPEVRHDMGKKFNQEDMDFNFEQALKHNIKIYSMMIVGYPTENEQSVQVAKNWLKTRTRFQPIVQFTWGGTLAVLPGTYLDTNREQYGLNVFGPPWQLWSSELSGSTPQKRVKWWQDLIDTSKSLGYNVSSGLENASMIDWLSNAEHQQPLSEIKLNQFESQTVK